MAEDKQVTKSTPLEYEVIEYNGKEARRYPNGVIKNPKGQMVWAPTEYYREMQRLGKIRGRVSAGDALAHKTNSETAEEGWGKVLMKVIDRAMQDKNGRVANDAARLVGLATGFLTRETNLEVGGNVTHQPVLGALPKKYLEYIKTIAERDVIDGEVKDDDNDED